MPDFTVERTFCCVFTALIATAGCSGKPSGGQARPVDNVSLGNGIDPIKGRALEDIYNLLNKTVIQNLIVDHSNITNGSLLTDQLNQLLAFGKPTKEQPTSTTSTNTKSPLEYQPHKPTFAGNFFSGRPGQLVPSGEPLPAQAITTEQVLEDRFKETSTTTATTSTNIKSPLEYQPHKPSYAGNFSSGRPGQLVPPGKPWPAQAITTEQVLEDRFKETLTTTATTSTNTKSPLEYQPHKPSYAGNFSSGRPGQLVPPGKPWPAQATTQQQTLEDRFKESTSESPTVSYTSDTPTSSKLPSIPHGPFFAGEFSAGRPGQLVPPGKSWPADPPNATSQLSSLKDRFQETKPTTTTDRAVLSSRLPLEYQSHRPSYAGNFSNGRPGQLVPPGKPWPANP